jgi:hypothetical protein
MLWSSFQGMMLLPMYNGKVEWPTRASCFYLCFILSEITFNGMIFAPNVIKILHLFLSYARDT